MQPYFAEVHQLPDLQRGVSTVNWRRGLFRAWVLFTVVWLALVIAFGLVQPAPSDCRAQNSATPWVCDQEVGKAEVQPSQQGASWSELALLAILIPGGIFLLGLGGIWTADGFRRSEA